MSVARIPGVPPWLLVALMGAGAVLFAAACGGGGDDVPDTVRLAGTPIPTASAEPTPAPVCDPPVALPVPANFPPEVRLPTSMVVWRVITTPHLRLEGRVVDPTLDSASAQRNVDQGITAALRFEGFTISDKPGPLGGYLFSAPDGRMGEYLGIPIDECPGQVELIYELYWVTG